MPYNLDFLTGGCNGYEMCVSWSKTNGLAYACDSNIIILRLNENEELIFDYCISEHTSDVKCLKFLCVHEKEFLVSSSYNNELILFQINADEKKYKQIFKEKYESSPALNFLIQENKVTFFLIGETINQLLLVLEDEHIKCEIIEKFEFKDFFPLCACPFEIKGLTLVAIGGTSNLVYFCDPSNHCCPIILKLKGHEDWVKAISITKPPSSDYTLVSTCSQDRTICIWKISLSNESKNRDKTITNLINKHFFSLKLDSGLSQEFCVTKDSILLCHESRVTAIDWLDNADTFPNLLSVGMDELIIIWNYDFSNNLWNEQIRICGRNSEKCGYMGYSSNTSRTKIVAYGKDGALHLWVRQDIHKSFLERHAQSGNSDVVTDIAIGPNGIPIIATCSLDKTVRVYGLVDSYYQIWSEISRPFIHGHNFNAISWLNEFNLVTAASEKPLRLHEPSKVFYQILKKYNILKSYPDNIHHLSSCGLLQALNLTQIPNFDENKTNDIFGEIFKLQGEDNLNPGVFNDYFLKNCTLWPEKRLLYAHGNPVVNLVSNHSRTLLASSSEAKKNQDAFIVLWDTNTAKVVDKLYGHKLAISQMAFSNDEKNLISVSLDRTFMVFSTPFSPSDPQYKLDGAFKMVVLGENYVERAFNSVSWTADDSYFGTCSRDKKIIIFRLDTFTSQTISALTAQLKSDAEPLHICFCSQKNSHECISYIFAIAFISSELYLYNFSPIKNSLMPLMKIAQPYAPNSPITCLKQFRVPDNHSFKLAIASRDKTFRIMSFYDF